MIIDEIKTGREAEYHGGVILGIIRNKRNLNAEMYRGLRKTYNSIKRKAEELGENVADWKSLPKDSCLLRA
jgi:hypothetical protein